MSPLYDFLCKPCKWLKTDIVNSNVEEIKCPKCGKMAQRQLGVPALRFKGSGWATRRPIETFANEPDDPGKWGPETHGISAPMATEDE